MGRRPKAAPELETVTAPAPLELEQLHEVDSIEGAHLVEYEDPDAVGWSGWYEDEGAPGGAEGRPRVAVAFRTLEGAIMAPNADVEPADTKGAQASTPRKRKAAAGPPKRKKGDAVQFLFKGPHLTQCAARVVAVGKGGRLDLEVDPRGTGKTHVREGIPWGDGKTADTWN